jgi:hypothetical protein
LGGGIAKRRASRHHGKAAALQSAGLATRRSGNVSPIRGICPRALTADWRPAILPAIRTLW